MNAYDQRRLELREESTAKILDAAISLFGEKGYVNTSIKDIADKSGVSLALVFKYFESKEKLLSAAYRYAVAGAYPITKENLILLEWTEVLIKQSIEVMKTKPETFDFFMMLLYTSDLPESYHAARRDFFYQAPIYPAMEIWQKLRELPEGNPFDYFMAFMRTMYTILDFNRKMSALRNDKQINPSVLLTYIIGIVEEDLKTVPEAN